MAYDSEQMSAYLRSFYGEAPLDAIREATRGTDYVLRECRSCALIFQEYVPDDELLDELYEKWLDPIASEAHSQQKRLEGRLALQVLEVIDHFEPRLPHEIGVLDFGMGWGNFCQVARGLGCDVAGSELSETRRLRASELGIPLVDLEESATRRFDFVNTEQVFEHLTRPVEVLQALCDVLSDEGVVRLSVPNCVDIKARLRHGDWTAPKGTKHSLNAVAPLEHVNCYQHKSLVALASHVGLRPIYRPWQQLRFAPTWEPPAGALRLVASRLYRGLRHQDTQTWFTRAQP